jgi:hypothetical protein
MASHIAKVRFKYGVSDLYKDEIDEFRAYKTNGIRTSVKFTVRD